MGEFFQALSQYTFLQYAVLASVLASLACGIVGTYIVVKRIVFIAGGIAHTVLGGMGIAYYLAKMSAVDPRYPVMAGAIAAALFAAVVIGLVSLYAREREDTIIGALWAVGMAVGVLFMIKTPGYSADLMSYLFGNILAVGKTDLVIIAALDALVLLCVVLFYKQFLAVCFDEEYATIQRVRVPAVYLLLLCLVAVTVVMLIQVVGLILVIALLTLPAAIAGTWSRSLWQMMALSVLLGMIFTLAGLAVSYGPSLPSGATIVLIAGGVYILNTLVRKFMRQARKPLAKVE
jgi:zinc transport system permease protein